MKTALITGTSSGIGLATANMLLSKGWLVLGLSRSKSLIKHSNYIDYNLDLTDINNTELLIRKLAKEYSISLVINNAGVGYYGLCEELNSRKIQEIVTVNLEIPILITSLLMRNLKSVSGTIINISSVTAEKSNPHGAAYGASKAGLTSFGASIFDEARKYGVRVITIEPDMTLTNLYRNADFTASEDDGCFLEPEDVANAVDYAITSGYVTKMILQPRFHRIRRKDPVK